MEAVKEQRKHYLLTIENDLIMNEYPLENHPKNFDQIAGGVKIFKKKWNTSFLLRFLFNILLPLILVVYDFSIIIWYSIICITHKKKKIHPHQLFVSCHNRLYNVGLYAGLINDDSIWFSTPLDSFKLPRHYLILSVFDYLSIIDVFICLYQTIISRWESVIKYGYKTLFLTQKVYSWMATDTALRKVPDDVELLFANNVDRIAILIDHLPQKKKSLVQHGVLHFYHCTGEDPRFTFNEQYGFWTWNCLYRFLTLSKMYCYTEKDKLAYQISNMSCKPEFVIIGYAFKPAFKPANKSVLIIADPTHFIEKEELIIRQLQGLDLDLYLKNHPVEPDSYYDELKKHYQFIYLPGMTKELPAVDVVFSYDSTLAYEYEALGTKVFYYYTFEWNEVRNLVKNHLLLNNEVL